MTTRRLGVAAAIVDGERVDGDMAIADGRIAEVGLASPAGSGVAVPGLIDLQVNGFGGIDFLTEDDDDAWRLAGERLLAAGVTAYQPTLITSPEAAVRAGLQRAARLRDQDTSTGARILGVHLEGPFLSPQKLGTHPAEHRRDPDMALQHRYLADGPVTMVTLAPELDGAMGLIDALVARGVVVSLGHTVAPAELARGAFERGARAVTHVFNAMAPVGGRDPGVAGTALARPDVTVMCIIDGVHLAEEVERLVLTAAGGRVVLTSDAMAAAGMGDGSFRLGTVGVDVRAGRATSADGTLAGGARTIADALRRTVELGVPLARAVAAATAVPARLLGRPDLGVIRPGAAADVVVLDDDLRATQVLKDGSMLKEAAR
jgi:N-acetylglucosamine-6-phosphate deacetylase